MVIKAAGRGRGTHMHTHRQTVGRGVGVSQKIRLLREGEAHTCIHTDRRGYGVTGCGGVEHEHIKDPLLILQDFGLIVCNHCLLHSEIWQELQ